MERATGTVAEATKSPRARATCPCIGSSIPKWNRGQPWNGQRDRWPIGTGRGGMLEKYIRTDSISYPGLFRGPLVAADGTVLGVNTSGLANGAAVTIPSDIAWRIADTLVKHGRIQHGYLGIRSQTVEIPAASQKALKHEQATGLLIVGVENDSPASKGGLIVGDILVAVAGCPFFIMMSSLLASMEMWLVNPCRSMFYAAVSLKPLM